MNSKVKIIVTGIPINYFNLGEYNRKTLELATSLQRELGDVSVILNEGRIVEVVENPEVYRQKTLIEPGLMSHRRKTSTKINKLFTHLLAMRRKLDISVIILVGEYEWLDKRVKYMWDIVERFNYEDYERLGVEI